MVVWIAVYLVVLAGVFGLLKVLTQGDPIATVRGTEPLSDERIRAIIDKPLVEAKNPGLADSLRAEAVNMYQQWQAGTTTPDHLYRSVRKFKESLAHQKAEDFALETARTETGEIMRVQTMFEQVKDELIAEVRVAYKNAYRDQRAGQLFRAAEGYRMLQQIIPEPQDEIYKSATEQLNVVNAALLQQKAHSGPRRF